MFAVLNLQASGTGSLRQALLSANSHAGPDVISFAVAGTIRMTTNALPAITDPVSIDGTTAPGYAGSPFVAVDSNGMVGLRFNAGSDGSVLRGLGLVNASAVGVSINNSSNIVVAGNYIGLGLNGKTIASNLGSGVELTASSNNTIGGTTAADRNVISGNGAVGIRLNGSANNQILGNYIGTDATGTLKRGNSGNGVGVTFKSIGNTISANVISGNGGHGVFINAQSTLTNVAGNLIGTTSQGNAALGNHLDGVRVENANNNLVGHDDPLTDVTYSNGNNFPGAVSVWQGIRGGDAGGQYLIAGTSGNNGLLFAGTLAGAGTSYTVNYPGATTSSIYGPDDLHGGAVRLVGVYKNADFQTAPVTVNGFLYEGTTADFANAANYRTIDYPGARFNYVHSTMGGLAVGNYDSPIDHGSFNLPLGPGHAYIYNIAADAFLTDIVFPGSKSNTAYGIWRNGGTSYTICGGYSLDPVNNLDDQNHPIGQGYLVDYDSATGVFTHWTSFAYPNGNNFVTHFEGISSVESGVYTLNADSVQSGASNPVQASWVAVHRNADGAFGAAKWVDLNYPVADSSANVTSSNSVYGNQVVGLVIGSEGTPFQATVNQTFQLSNVISANGGNGITLNVANNNHIAMNFVGTDVTGTIDLGNAKNGITIANGAKSNLVGGSVSGGNDPTGAVFVRPPLGNLISGNNANGVLILNMATGNTLSGNFVGTNAAGTAALGNGLDGVAILNANGNSLIGCTLQENPFVYYNVIAGNVGNGLRVTNSNDTTIQANFFGMGADNNTAVGNVRNGVVVEGTSANTIMGGPIPLGNVVAANKQNGLVVRDTASGFVTYNTFCGLAAFSDVTTFGNALDGMLITSTGSNILIRTNVITSNGDDGIEISGNAHGVRVAGNIIGLNTSGNLPMGNVGNGVEVGGDAYNIIVGGPQPTFNIIPHNAISANGANGVAIVGRAHNVRLDFSFIGTNLNGMAAFGNAQNGVSVGPGTYANSIGSPDPNLFTVISGNVGNGVELNGTHGNTVVGNFIGTDSLGLSPLPNGANGVDIRNSFGNVIGRLSQGGDGPANRIAFNNGNGVLVESGSRNGIHANSILGNVLLGIDVVAGANGNPVVPVLASVGKVPQGTMIAGSITGKANTTFVIEFYDNTTAASSGTYFVGAQTVTTNALGIAGFNYLGKSGAAYLTATATDLNDNTSEFSLAVA